MAELARGPHAEQIDELRLRITGLLRVRELLRRQGAGEAELEAHSAEIGRLCWRLFRLVVESGRAAAAE
jgi:hypothetical protein